MLPINTCAFLIPFAYICVITNQTNPFNSPSICHSFTLILVLIIFSSHQGHSSYFFWLQHTWPFPKSQSEFHLLWEALSLLPLSITHSSFSLSDNLSIATLRFLLFYVHVAFASPIRFKHLKDYFLIFVQYARQQDHHLSQVINYQKTFKRYYFFFISKKTVNWEIYEKYKIRKIYPVSLQIFLEILKDHICS